MLRLSVIKGAEKGRSYPLSKQGTEITFGRGASNAIQIADEKVSRKNHASIAVTDQGIIIKDLESRNGTFVNGASIKEKKLKIGDEIQIGDTVFLLEEDVDEGSAPEKDVQKEKSTDFVAARTIVDAGEKRFLVQEKSSRTQRVLTALYEITNAVSSARELDELLNSVLALVLDVLPADRVFIMLVDQQDEGVWPRLVRSRFRTGVGQETSISDTIIDKVTKSGESLLVSDAMADDDLKNHASVKIHSIRSVICVPLKTKEAVLGVLHVDTAASAGAFSEEDVHLLAAIGKQAAIAIENVELNERIMAENKVLRRQLEPMDPLLGESPEMKSIRAFIDKVANVDSPVLLRGESGTGKELVAHAIHSSSQRAGGPFVVVECSSLPESLLETELFGHEKGAFTGASDQRKGMFELAEGGTLFLDEIGDMHIESQAKILGAIERKEIRRVGGPKQIKIDVRIIAASNKDLEKAIKEGTFRHDLFYRLSVLPMALPPLRERKGDIDLLIDYFLKKFSSKHNRQNFSLSRESREILLNHTWPGNVRELKNTLERVVVLATSNHVKHEEIQSLLYPQISMAHEVLPTTPGIDEAKANVEKELILQKLEEHHWHKINTARALGMDRVTLYRKMRQYNIS